MRAVPRPSLRQLVVALPFVACFIVLFWPTFEWMAERFDSVNSFYSHGWLIPFATGWLIWQRRERLIACREGARPVRSQDATGNTRRSNGASFWGLALLVPALVIHTVATLLDIGFVSGFAMVGAIWGLVWTLWGWQTLSVLRFPMLFLLFMVPLPSILLIATSFHMKLMAAGMATHLLNFAGMAVTQAGSTIYTPTISVVVDDTCSGLRSLISLFALATLWTSLLPPSSKPWQRLLIVAASIPIALAANMLRILTLVLLSAIYGPSVAAGFIHYGSGLVVFGFAILALAWLSRTLVKPVPEGAGGSVS